MSNLKSLMMIRKGLFFVLGLSFMIFLGGSLSGVFLHWESDWQDLAWNFTFAGIFATFATTFFITVIERSIQKITPGKFGKIEKLVAIRRLILFSLGLGILLGQGASIIEHHMPWQSNLEKTFQVLEKTGFVLFFGTLAFFHIFNTRIKAANAGTVLWDEYWKKIAGKALITSYFILLLSLVFAPLLNIFWDVSLSDIMFMVITLGMVFPAFYIVWLDRPGGEGG